MENMQEFLENYRSKVEFHKQMLDSFLEQYRAHKKKEMAEAGAAAIAKSELYSKLVASSLRAVNYSEYNEMPGSNASKIGKLDLGKLTPSEDWSVICKNCRYWDISCRECDHPHNRAMRDTPDEFSVRRCGPEFGCVNFERGNRLDKHFEKE